jgi:hypothetical protein
VAASDNAGCRQVGCVSLLVLFIVIGYFSSTTTPPTTTTTTADPVEAAPDSIMAGTPLAEVRNLSSMDLALVTQYAQADSGKIKAAKKEQARRDAERSAEIAKRRVGDIQAMASCKPSASRVKSLVTRHPGWSDTHIAHIACRSVVIGMNSDQAIAAWGRPDDVNRTTSAYGVSEQWVYEDSDGIPRSYLYFDDGVLTTVQN